ncbi:Fanconi anemia group D2 protein-like 2, partial [Homarus americanus]
NLYDTTPELTPAILDTLGHLTLAPKDLEDVHHSVLKSLQAARPEQLPVVTKFLLSNTPQPMAYQINLPGDSRRVRKSPQKLTGKFASSRSAVNTNNDNDNIAYEILLLNNIKTVTLIHRFLSTAWLKAIQDVYDVAGVRPLDFLILLMFYDSVPSQRRAIESIFRNKIRTGFFSDTLLEKIFTNHSCVLKENFEPLKKLANLLLRCPEPIISQTGASLYRLSFLHLDGYQQQEIVLALLKHLGDNVAVRFTALSLLSLLAHQYTAAMSKFTIFLKGSLDVVDELGIGEVKRLLDVVSLLVYCDSSHAALQDELIILKNMILYLVMEHQYKLIGVLNAALAMKNMVVRDDSLSTTTSSKSSGSGLNTSSLKEAENLLCLVLSSTAKSPTASALFMDEMASITLKEGMNSKLEEWVCDKMINDFQNTFVLDYALDSQPPEDLFALEACWSLNTDVDDTGIIMNLAPLVIKAEATRNDPVAKESKMVSLAPQFRLLRMLESRIQEGNLGNIDALLGCPVYGPATSVFEKFDILTKMEQHAALSCIFYTINWFLELINAFVTQKDSDLKQKVYSRVRHVIHLQNTLLQLLIKCPGYSPPLAVFDLDTSSALPSFTITSSKKGKRGRKSKSGKGKSKGKNNNGEATQVGATQANSQPTTQPTIQPTALTQGEDKETVNTEVSSSVDMTTLRPYFRELHLDVFCLLFRKLGLETDVEDRSRLSLSEAEFLLTDLNFKLTHVFRNGNKRASVLGHGSEKSIGYSHLDLFTPAEVAQRAFRFLKPVCVHMESINDFFQNMIADNDGIMDAPGMFSEKTCPLIKVNTLLFTTLSIFLSWNGLQLEENKETLTEVLHTIAKKLEGDVKDMEEEELVSTVFRYISNFHESIVSIHTASILVQTLVAITALPRHEDFSESFVTIIEELLKRDWYTTGGVKEKGAVYNQYVHNLLQEYLRQSKNPLSLIEKICKTAIKEFHGASGRDPQSDTFPTLNKGTLGVYFRCMISFLVSSTKQSLSAIGTASADDKLKCLLVWNTAINIFHTLIIILKKNNTKHLLISCLKYSRSFVDLFLRSAMPLMDSCLRQHNKEVMTIFSSLQVSTRLLQNVCTHSKVNQDISLTRYVPLVKKSLEMLVYRVKAMLARNKCSSAFWMGNLKNRDLQGEEILSLSGTEANQEEEGNEEEEEEELEDINDDQSDVDLDEEEEDDRSTDYSNSF